VRPDGLSSDLSAGEYVDKGTILVAHQRISKASPLVLPILEKPGLHFLEIEFPDFEVIFEFRYPEERG